MTVRENLIAAKARIDTPEKWAKGSGSYMPENVTDPVCVLGACHQSRSEDEAVEFLRGHIPAIFNRSFIRFNDHPVTTHADVMALFDRAIAACPDP